MKKHCLLWIAVFLALYSAKAEAAGFYVLANGKLRITLSETGKLDSVENLLAGETYSFGADAFTLDTNLGLFSNNTVKPARVTVGKHRVVFRYEFGPSIGADLVYSLDGHNGFFRRAISVANKTSLRVKNLILGKTAFAKPAMETVHYVTFIAAPTVEFIRHDKGGLFTGIENPYFEADVSEQGVTLNFEPALILKPGEGYTSEPQFMGVYKRSGVMIEDSGREFRYNANGSGYKPLDRNEIRAMRAFALDYLAPAQDQFLNINCGVGPGIAPGPQPQTGRASFPSIRLSRVS